MDEIYTIEEIAKKLQINEAKLYRMIKENKFPYTNISAGEQRKQYRVTGEQLHDWLEANKNG